MKNIPFLLLLPFLASCSTQYIENITIQKEDTLVQIEKYLENSKGECKLIYSSEKKTNTQSILNRCDCIFDEMLNGYKTELIKDQNENFDFETFNKKLFKDIEKKCGKLPDLKK